MFEGYTHRVVSSYNTGGTSREGWAPGQARAPTSHGEQCNGCVTDFDTWKSTKSVTKGCTQLDWGAILIPSDSRNSDGESGKPTKPKIKGCTQLDWGAILIDSSKCSSRGNSGDSICEQCTNRGKYEGHTRLQRGVASYEVCSTKKAHEGYTCGGQGVTSCEKMRNESWKPPDLGTEGCTQLHWGATLVEAKPRGSVKGCTQFHWGATLSFPRNNEDFRTEPCEGWTPCGGSTSYEERFDWSPMIKGCTQLHCGATLIRANDTGKTEYEGYTCRLQGITSYGNEADPPARKKCMDCPHNHVTRNCTGLSPDCTPDIYQIDDMTVDDLMMDDPCLLRAGGILSDNSLQGRDNRPPTEGSYKSTNKRKKQRNKKTKTNKRTNQQADTQTDRTHTQTNKHDKSKALPH